VKKKREKRKKQTRRLPSLPDPQYKKEKEARNMKRMPKLEPLFSMRVSFPLQSTGSDSQCSGVFVRRTVALECFFKCQS